MWNSHGRWNFRFILEVFSKEITFCEWIIVDEEYVIKFGELMSNSFQMLRNEGAVVKLTWCVPEKGLCLSVKGL